MKKNIQTTLIALLALLPLGMQAQSVVTEELYKGTQILNSDFEDFHIVNKKTEPDYWHSFATAQGALAGWATQDLEQMEGDNNKRPGSKGKSSVAIRSTSIFGFVANATLTTGRMNAGAMTASDINNHAFMVVSDAEDDAGFPFYAKLTERPTAISVWLKFTPKSGESKANLSAVITNGKRYQEPKDSAYTYVIVGEAKDSVIDASVDWQHLVIPFKYDGFKGGDPQAIMVTLSTNATPGAGSKGDELLIDDLELIYTRTIEIPASGYATFAAVKNNSIKLPEGLKGYALGSTANNEPIIIKTYKAGDVVPYTPLLLEGEPGYYTISTTLYETGEKTKLNEDVRLVPATEFNSPLDGYDYFFLTENNYTLGFYKPSPGIKIEEYKALLRVKSGLAAENYQHVLYKAEKEGDVDGNGKVEATDVKALVDRLLGNQLGMKGFLVPDADVNNDGRTTVADVTNLVNILMNE